MKAFNLTIDTVNSAFADMNGQVEVVRILRKLADKLTSERYDGGNLRDFNGNTVGEANVYEEAP